MPFAKFIGLAAGLTCMFSLLVSCDDSKLPDAALRGSPDDPVVAIFAFEDGKGCIRAGKLRSGHFKKFCDGDYPSLSPSGRFLAYNKSTRNGIRAVRVIEIQTGKVTIFDSIPREALFVGRRVKSPYDDKDVMPGKIYLIKPESMDWANASEKEWEKAKIMDGEQVSLSR